MKCKHCGLEITNEPPERQDGFDYGWFHVVNSWEKYMNCEMAKSRGYSYGTTYAEPDYFKEYIKLVKTL